MKCSRCGEEGAIRREIHFNEGARIVTYLCDDCADAERDLEEVEDLVSYPVK